MNRKNVSFNVVRRLPRYLRKLDDLIADGVERVSSAELGKMLYLTSSQIRQDMSCFGEFGQQGYGYNVKSLRAELASIMGMDRSFSIVIFGMGPMGRAVADLILSDSLGFRLLGLFDKDPAMAGTEFEGLTVMDAADLPGFIRENSVDIAAICTSMDTATADSKLAAEAGVCGIWNFTNRDLDAFDADIPVLDAHVISSLLALSYYVAEKRDSQSPGESGE